MNNKKITVNGVELTLTQIKEALGSEFNVVRVSPPRYVYVSADEQIRQHGECGVVVERSGLKPHCGYVVGTKAALSLKYLARHLRAAADAIDELELGD